MSTVTLNYPDAIRARRVPAIGRTLILSSLALIAIITLVMVRSAANTERAVVSQNSIAPIPVPVATPLITEIQPVPSETPLPSSGLPSEPSIAPVPVPTPSSQ